MPDELLRESLEKAITFISSDEGVERIARRLRKAWISYCEGSLSNPPPAFTKPWEETTEWSKDANRYSAMAASKEIFDIVTEILAEEEDAYKKSQERAKDRT